MDRLLKLKYILEEYKFKTLLRNQKFPNGEGFRKFIECENQDGDQIILILTVFSHTQIFYFSGKNNNEFSVYFYNWK